MISGIKNMLERRFHDLWEWRFEKRIEVGPWVAIISRAVAVLLSLILAGIAIELTGKPVIDLASSAFLHTLGSKKGLINAAVLATPLILTGLSVALCMKMQLWNIGAEGQFFIGAWAATAIGLSLEGPHILVLVMMLLGGALAGAAWMLLPALARAYANADEIITTLMLNFVAILFVNFWAVGPWRDKKVGMASASSRIPYDLPTILNSSSLHIGFVIAIIVAIILFLIIQYTRLGYEVTIIGKNRRAAEFTGILVERNILFVMLLSGALAGLAGAVELAGTAHRLSGFISNRYGYLGIIVAALASASPIIVIISGYLLAAFLNAGIVLQTQGIPFNVFYALTGAMLLFVSISEVVSQYRLVHGSVKDNLKEQHNIDVKGENSLRSESLDSSQPNSYKRNHSKD